MRSCKKLWASGASPKRLWIKQSKIQKHSRPLFSWFSQSDQQHKLPSLPNTVRIFFLIMSKLQEDPVRTRANTRTCTSCATKPAHFCQEVISTRKSHFLSFTSVCSVTSLLAFSMIK